MEVKKNGAIHWASGSTCAKDELTVLIYFSLEITKPVPKYNSWYGRTIPVWKGLDATTEQAYFQPLLAKDQINMEL